jgi:glycosyltransferase involved in cell wall biosynthesis
VTDDRDHLGADVEGHPGHRAWMESVGAVADHIAGEIKPRRVLDMGCAGGYLVQALRDRGVDAFGIHISELGPADVSPNPHPHCRIATALAPFEERYDLIVCVEVLEHLTEDVGRRAIANLCRCTADVLLCWVPDGLAAPAHDTARPRSWWIERFAEQGFHLDVEFDSAFGAADPMRFKAGPAVRSPLDTLLVQRHRLVERVVALRADTDHQDARVARLEGQIEARDAIITSLQRSAEDKDKLIASLNYHLLAMQRTIGWKILTRLRRLRDRLLPPESRRRDLYWQVRRTVEVLLDEGLAAFCRKTQYKIRLKWRGQKFLIKAPSHETLDLEVQYQLWVERHRITPSDAGRMTAELKAFAYMPVISIVTPVYNTDEVPLRKAIESARAQIYPHWELCLVNDGSTKPHVRALLEEYVALEPRVWVKHLSRNHGIGAASSFGLDLATGDFVAFLDHDDELPPEALFEVAKRLNADPELDLIYTDEDKLDLDGRRVEPFFKPDWNPDLLLSMNYITHLSVYRRSLLREIGGVRLGFDGSQDYDLLLRFTERTRRIAHIPNVLYHWRKSAGSVAASSHAKPFAYEAGRQAIEEAVRRRGYEARVETLLPGQYGVRYKHSGVPLVSIIIPTRDRWPLLQQCLRSIEEKTTYGRYEIIVLDNDSTDPETLKGLNAIANTWRVYPYPGSFNFSALNNFGTAQARGEYFVFLNNDTQVVEPDWLTAMLEHARRPEVGAVGARLHYPDGRIQHAGLVLGVGGVADHAFKGLPGDGSTYFGLVNVVRNVSAVTAACMMVPRRAFEEVGGFDERLQVALNDVDLCLRLRARNYLIVWTPFALLYHHESGTRGGLHPPKDEELVWTVWGDLIRSGDPYYNPNLTLSRTDWSLRS